MPVTVGPYGQSQPSCFDRVKMGFMMGFAVGMAAGALFGTFSCLRYLEHQQVKPFLPAACQEGTVSWYRCRKTYTWAMGEGRSSAPKRSSGFGGSSSGTGHRSPAPCGGRRIGMRGRELMGGVGKTMMQSGGTFGTFMAIGMGIRC